MRVSLTNPSARVERNKYNLTRKIKNYGDGNDYPQKVLQIVNSSGTGKACLDIRKDFCEGGGFIDESLAEFIVNEKNETANLILSKACQDAETFDGFPLVIKYSGLGLPSEIYYVPFEQIRFEINEKKQLTGRYAIHSDWTRLNGLPFDEEEIKYLYPFAPEKVRDQMKDAGGPGEYLGQLFFWTESGNIEYPICPFDAIITDMLTEDSVSTVKHRNAKNGFMPAAMIIRKGKRYSTTRDGRIDLTDGKYDEDQQSANEIKKIQGDENSSKLIVIDIDSEEEMPEIKPFETANFDKRFELTEKTIQENIARHMKVPPLLRGSDVGTGFGSERMKVEYEVMNSHLGKRRRKISAAFKRVFEYFPVQFNDFDIKPLEYITNDKSSNTE